MTASDMTALVVGANGNLGQRIAKALRARGLQVRSGVRDPDRAPGLLQELGEVVRADLTDPASLAAACDGVQVVISAVQGGPEVIVDGQSRLLAAAQQAGVTRFVPSDYSLDLFALAPGENWNSDARRAFDRQLIDSGQGYTIVLNGCFMEVIASPFLDLIDDTAGTLSFWGDGETPADFTSMDDAAAYLAEIVCDPGTLNRVVQVVGETATMADIARFYRQATGRPLTLRSRGSIADGYAELQRREAEGADLMRILPLMYQLPMMSGRGRLENPENDRYPNIAPTTLTAVLRGPSPSE
ncbi:NmrA family NAD(P)-binding protein [Mycobacterium sp. M1]|uniref:NmrA family NAD(P)-binding protein n=1 Tax=Mycolicibacter acidiphilus TaxID=2835306 RepID=A0ABS5RIZ1_9MYCO|nr:NmrA family NAD(P)-binding protein [Mycolicibacter acidiphilus]MBS9534262.1 NmrA family NAD(P)-binding protein [Mycolicibacter acidiphilus]